MMNYINENNKKIYIIEGVSNVGKTTLCRKLEEQYGFVVVQEAIRYLEQDYQKPGSDILKIPNTIDEEKDNQDILFKKEYEKLCYASELCKNGFNVAIDKSMLGIIATAYAFEQEKKYEGSFQYSVKIYKEYMKKAKSSNIMLPSAIILLDSEVEICRKRNVLRGHVLESEWIDPEITNKQRHFLWLYSCFTDIPVKLIKTSELTAEQVLDRVLQYMNDFS